MKTWSVACEGAVLAMGDGIGWATGNPVRRAAFSLSG